MPRKKQEPIDTEVARSVGGLLRGLRKAAGYRAVKDVAGAKGVPAAPQTIYAYERGGLVPSLRQFLELVDFYVGRDDASMEARYMGVAAVHAALSSPAYHVAEALALVNRLQPPPTPGRRRRGDAKKAGGARAKAARAARKR
ncbi:MAG: helix-turn-helix domain-containing protein [Actinomycetota bacterium]|nr:helix-turn-helix domain-containing protein [Actinomycetota bacterium]